VSHPAAAVPGYRRAGQAGNADIWLNYSAGAVGTFPELTPPPPIAEQVAATIAMARDVLAVLAR
jgi:hypothetical protein